MGDIFGNRLADPVRWAPNNVTSELESRVGSRLGKKASREKHSHQKVVQVGTHLKVLDTWALSLAWVNMSFHPCFMYLIIYTNMNILSCVWRCFTNLFQILNSTGKQIVNYLWFTNSSRSAFLHSTLFLRHYEKFRLLLLDDVTLLWVNCLLHRTCWRVATTISARMLTGSLPYDFTLTQAW